MGDYPFLANREDWQPNLPEWKFLGYAILKIEEARFGGDWRGDELQSFRLKALGGPLREADGRCWEVARIIAREAVGGRLHVGLMPQKDDNEPTLVPAEPSPCSAELWDCTISQLGRRFNYCRLNPELPDAGAHFSDFDDPAFKWIYVHVDGLERLLWTLESERNSLRVSPTKSALTLAVSSKVNEQHPQPAQQAIAVEPAKIRSVRRPNESKGDEIAGTASKAKDGSGKRDKVPGTNGKHDIGSSDCIQSRS